MIVKTIRTCFPIAAAAVSDKAEEITDEEYWPLPCYSRMLFYTE